LSLFFFVLRKFFVSYSNNTFFYRLALSLEKEQWPKSDHEKSCIAKANCRRSGWKLGQLCLG
jgi:hypothetical protein